MSPNEAQLRSFLHDGEGDVPDADSVISRALRVRYERRRRITAIAGGTAVVAVVATAASLLFAAGSGDSQNGGGTAAAGAFSAQHHAADAPAAGSEHGGGNGARQPSGMPLPPRARFGPATPAPSAGGVGADAKVPASDIACPATAIQYMLPGGGGLNSYGANSRMFARTPAAIRVCVYALAKPAGAVLTGAAARGLAAAIEKAPTTPGPRRACLMMPENAARQVELLPVDASGTRMRAVVITLSGCGSNRATNGTALRYIETLPRSVRPLLKRVSSPAR